jgi:predicted dehydrogenase
MMRRARPYEGVRAYRRHPSSDALWRGRLGVRNLSRAWRAHRAARPVHHPRGDRHHPPRRADLSIAGSHNERIVFDQSQVYIGSYTATIAHFVHALQGASPFETSPEDNLQTLRIVEDCYRLSGRAGG